MAKVLKTAALIVGVAALAVATAGASIGPTAAGLAGSAGIGALSITTAGTILGVAAAGLSLVANLVAPKPKVQPQVFGGNPTKFTIDKESGIPYPMGRTASGGKVIHRQYYGPKQVYESWVTVHGYGPVRGLEQLQLDGNLEAFSGGASTGNYTGVMWLDEQLGACPETRALAGPFGDFPGWDATSKLSGLAADLWTLKFDTTGKRFPAGIPQRKRIVLGVLVYDPRRDSTYPGGSGPCRIGQEATYVYSENPACHALTWAYGRYQNGVLVAGGGLEVDGIMMAPFVDWANVCDANGWKVGGIIYTSENNSWDVLKMIAQAGGGEVFQCGALLSCMFSAPRVSIGTIAAEDLAGDLDIPTSALVRDRRNTIIPRVRLEAQGWEMVPLDPVSVADYVALDGGKRPKEISYPLVQQADQGAELALYDLLNMREIDGLLIPAKVYAVGYLPGDCLTLDIPDANLVERDVILREREIDAASLVIGMTCRTETSGKHEYALGATGVPPRTPDLSVPNLGDLDAPGAGAWALAGATLTDNGVSIPALVVTGAVDDPNAEAVIFELRPAGATNWSSVSIDAPSVIRKEITGVTPGTSYEVAVSYRVRGVVGERRVLGPAAAGAFGTARGAFRLRGLSVEWPAASTDTTIGIAAFTAVLDDGTAISLPAQTLTGLTASTKYGLFYRLADGVWIATPSPSQAETASSDYAYLYDQWTAVDSGGSYEPTTTPPGGYGGSNGCLLDCEPLLLANADRTGPGETIPIGQARAGMWVWTEHEISRVEGAYRITKASRFECELYAAPDRPLASASHLFGVEDGWQRMADAGTPTGDRGWVVKLTVDEAASYCTMWKGARMLHHNKRETSE